MITELTQKKRLRSNCRRFCMFSAAFTLLSSPLEAFLHSYHRPCRISYPPLHKLYTPARSCSVVQDPNSRTRNRFQGRAYLDESVDELELSSKRGSSINKEEGNEDCQQLSSSSEGEGEQGHTLSINFLETEQPNLPILTEEDYILLRKGSRVQKQERNGRAGSGFVAVHVDAPAHTVFDVLTQFERYKEMIPTVREVSILARSDKDIMAEFFLSRFKLRVCVVKRVDREKKFIKFSLDPSKPNAALRRAEGFWFVESLPSKSSTSASANLSGPDGIDDETSSSSSTSSESESGESCRVWLCASIVASRLIPSLIVDYAAGRALPRATTWLRPFFGDGTASTVDENEGC